MENYMFFIFFHFYVVVAVKEVVYQAKFGDTDGYRITESFPNISKLKCAKICALHVRSKRKPNFGYDNKDSTCALLEKSNSVGQRYNNKWQLYIDMSNKAKCVYGGAKFENDCFVIDHKTVSWTNSKIGCEDKGGKLVEILNKETQSFLKDLVTKKKERKHLWVGAHNRVKRTMMWFPTHNRLHYHEWAPGEPSKGTFFMPGRCVTMNPNQGWKWTCVQCIGRYGSVCQIPWNGEMERVFDIEECGTQGGKGFQDSCYLLVKSSKTWSNAKNDCKSRNMSLLEITSWIEQEYVQFYIASVVKVHRDQHIWIGMYGRDSRGFRWVTSNTVPKFTFWAQGNPSGRKTIFDPQEECVEFSGFGGFHWNDIACKNSFPYICEGK